MMRTYLVVLMITYFFNLFSQTVDLHYYLPKISYDEKITRPDQFLGFQIGEWHVSHDQVVAYMKLIATESDRIEIREYARSHERRPLLLLTITDPKNHENIEHIKANHLQISDHPENDFDFKSMPLVLYQGYSVHGNESSGVNAAMLMTYYLAAGQSSEISKLLKNTIILLDPCYNPDGVQRFSTWANSHKGYTLITDPKTREYNEMWPGGRTNHYWFDLNRDWLYITHPESEGRVKIFQEWRPNILTDHHEMSSNSTFFFQPGVPSRVNKNTPWENQVLTEEIGKYHAAILDSIGSQYFTKKSFDDYYYGKGSTYPDIQGCIGILFEQASSRGHLQETDNGLLSFPFTIRNQVMTSLSTQKAAIDLREKLLTYQMDFYRNQKKKFESFQVKGYLITDLDKNKMARVLYILKQQDIKIQKLITDVIISSKNFKANDSYFISLSQRQAGLIHSAFEKVKTFQDSIFYDVSSWTMPLAFDLDYAEVSNVSTISLSPINDMDIMVKRSLHEGQLPTLYIMKWHNFNAAASLYELQKLGIQTKLISSKMEVLCNGKKLNFGSGDILISTTLEKSGYIKKHLEDLSKKFGVDIFGLDSGFAFGDIFPGSPDVSVLSKPSICTLVGQGVSAYDVGELWHFMDHHLHIPLTMLDKKDLSSASLQRYNTMILTEGSYADLSEFNVKKIEDWIKMGGLLITFESATSWANSKTWIKQIEIKKDIHIQAVDYASFGNSSFSQEIPGSIYQANLDMSHPMAFGFSDATIYTFKRSSRFVSIPTNKLASPLTYAKNAEVSGYVPKLHTGKADLTSAITLHTFGKGLCIAFADNPVFRGFWWGNYKLLDNAIFFGRTIDRNTMEGG